MTEKRYTTDELIDLPTLSMGQIDSLKIDTGDERIWLSRGTKADGLSHDHLIYHERYVEGQGWVNVLMYSGDDPATTIDRV